MRLVSYFVVTIDTDGRAPDRGERVEVLIEAAPFGSAEACRRAILDAYRGDFPHVAVAVTEVPVLTAKLTTDLHDAWRRDRVWARPACSTRRTRGDGLRLTGESLREAHDEPDEESNA